MSVSEMINPCNTNANGFDAALLGLVVIAAIWAVVGFLMPEVGQSAKRSEM